MFFSNSTALPTVNSSLVLLFQFISEKLNTIFLNVTSRICYLTFRLSCFNIPIGQSCVAKCQIFISFLKEKNPIGVNLFNEDLICSFHVKGTAHTSVSRGRDKRAYIAALRKAKIYPPRQAAAAAMHELHCRNARAAIHKMECSSSCALRQLVH